MPLGLPFGFNFVGAGGAALADSLRPRSFTDQFAGQDDRLVGLPEGDFTANNDLNRLEIIAANEGGGVRDRISRQFGALERVSDRAGEETAVAEAADRARTRSAADAAQFERSTRGLQLSGRQKRAATKRLGLSRALNRARITGTTRRGFADRARGAQAAGGGFADAIFGQRVSGETDLASAFAAKRASEIKEDADKKSSTLGLLGTIAGGALAFFSSEDLKVDHGREPRLLNKLKKVRVNRWQYHGDNKTHVGPFSEEFNREFGIETDRPDMINVIDALGVTLGAVKELNEKVESRARI